MSLPTLTLNPLAAYSAPAAVNPAAGRENPMKSRRTCAQDPIAGAFFTSAMSFYGGRAWADFGLAGCLDSRFLTPRTAATLTREKVGASSTNQGASPMANYAPTLSPRLTCNPLDILNAVGGAQ